MWRNEPKRECGEWWAWGDGEGFDVSSGGFFFWVSVCLVLRGHGAKADGHFILDSRGPIALFVVHGHTAQSYPQDD